MKKILTFIIIVFGFIQSKAQTNITLNSASKEIYDRIIFLESQLKELENNSSAKFYYAPGIIELSGISTKKVNGDYFGIHFEPDKNEIKSWKDWFEKNKNNFSYANNEDSKIVYELLNIRLIQIEYEKDKYRYDIPKETLEYYREVFEKIKKHER